MLGLPICDFADQFFPGLPKTISLNAEKTDHDGVFAVPASSVDAYMTTFNPQPLRYSRATKNVPGSPINFGNAKGMTFDRTIIFSHGPLKKFLRTGQVDDAGKAIEKIYVAVTRAKQSVAFVVDDGSPIASVPLYEI